MMEVRSERGSATVLTVAAASVVLLLALMTSVLAGYLVASHRARQTADLAAVSGAAVAARGEPGCPVAERVARANGARPVSCQQEGDRVEYIVTVEVLVRVHPPVRGLPNEVAGRAGAGHID